jgi:hypothetical protein
VDEDLRVARSHRSGDALGLTAALDEDEALAAAGKGGGCVRECSKLLCSENMIWDWTARRCQQCSELRNPLLCSKRDRLALSLEADGLRLVPQDPRKTRSARTLIGCAGYAGPRRTLALMDPALFVQP